MPDSETRARTPFEVLQFRVADAQWRWNVWKQLYMIGPEGEEEAKTRLRLLSQHGSAIFQVLYDILLQDVVLRVCKWADPPRSHSKGGPRRNLSLSAAVEEAKPRLSNVQATTADKLLIDFKDATAQMIKLRHWVFAHDDYEIAMGVEPRPSIRDTDVDNAMNASIELMTLLDPKSPLVEFGYRHLIAAGDGRSIVTALKFADRWIKHCFREGRSPSCEDFER